MKEFIEYIVKNLVENPDNVHVECIEKEEGISIKVRVDPRDAGKLIGRKGLTINALRTIATTVCGRLGTRVRIDLIDQ